MSTRRGTASLGSSPLTSFLRALPWLLPILLIVSVFCLIPIFAGFYGSLFRDISYLPKSFIAFDNYSAIFASEDFWISLAFTLVFTVTAVSLETFFGLGFALLLHENFRGRGILRAVILIPWAIPTIVSAKVWKLIFDYTYGLLNWFVLYVGWSEEKINWLGTTSAAFGSVVAAEVWKTTPFMVLILLAGLQAVPDEWHEQAQVDGAGTFRRFLSITLPGIRPVLVVALIFRTIDSMRIFDLIYVLTGGGPGGSTRSLSMMGFEYYSNDAYGKGSAVSVITFLIVFGITLLYVRAGRFHRES